MGRSKGIGGTDISAIVGMNPFKTPLDVWLSKTGQAPPDEDNENKWWGREMEPVLAKRYEKETGTHLYLPDQFDNPLKHKTFNWYLGSPDALVNAGNLSKHLVEAEGGVDFKTSGRPQEWGEPGTDEVPQHYVIQAEWYMGLTGAQFWDIAVLLMGFTRKFAIYRISRDDELIDSLTEAGETFWKDHVLTNVAPPLDGSKSATEYLKRLYPQDRAPILEPTDEEILADIDRFRETKEELKHLESVVSMYENRLKSIIGDCAGMKGEWGKITWTKNKDSRRVDWRLIAESIADAHNIPLTRYTNSFQFTTIKPGARVFRPHFAKED